jgi:hypothetical protein
MDHKIFMSGGKMMQQIANGREAKPLESLSSRRTDALELQQRHL